MLTCPSKAMQIFDSADLQQVFSSTEVNLKL